MSSITDNSQRLKTQADALWESGDIKKAIEFYETAIQHSPEYFQAYANLGTCLTHIGRYTDAITQYKQAIKIRPDIAGLYSNIANTYNQLKESDLAIENAKQALALDPVNFVALNNIGLAFLDKNDYPKAIHYLERALNSAPDNFEINLNLSTCYKELSQFAKAKEYAKTALMLYPNSAHALTQIANICSKNKDFIEAIQYARQALTIEPVDPNLHSLLLSLLTSRGILSPEALHAENLHWDELHGRHAANEVFSHQLLRSSTRRIKIGYVSGDFRNHAVSYFFEPIISNHDRNKFEITCYSNLAITNEDQVTNRLRQYADHWTNVWELSEHALASRIYDDKIDILIDLSGHTDKNRLPAFTYKPAPIQVTYLGYYGATGLKAIDYWLTDWIIHPKDTPELSVEEKYRLPRCFYCFMPPKDSPEVLSESRSRQLTFGSFNQYQKMTDKMFDAWAQILTNVPDSDLLIKNRDIENPVIRNSIIEEFTKRNIDSNRLIIRSRTPSHREHLDMYNDVDVILDTFPFTGATTTADAIWMGLPVVSLAGSTLIGRFSASLLHAVNLDELVVSSIEEYVGLATNLISNKSYLKELRTTLRSRMLDSELCDAPGLAAAIEAFYVEAFQHRFP